jgi:hypothetical protein
MAQDSLPVAGQALLDGVRTRKVPMKGFKAVNYISFPFPKLLVAIDVTDAGYDRASATTRRLPTVVKLMTTFAAVNCGWWVPPLYFVAIPFRQRLMQSLSRSELGNSLPSPSPRLK